MKKAVAIVLILALVGGGFFAWRVYFSDEKRIVRQLRELEELLHWRPDDGNFARAARASRLRDLFTDDVTMEVNVARGEVRRFEGEENLQGLIMRAQIALPVLRVDIPSISAKADGDSAVARMTTFLYIGNENREPFLQELELNLVKIDNKWRIKNVQTIKTLAE